MTAPASDQTAPQNAFTDADVARAEATAPPDAPQDDVADAAFDLILLDPARVRLFRTGGSTVRATIDDPQIGAERTYVRVQVARAYPLTDPNRYIGLRDEKDKDIGMLATLDGLDADSRRILEEELTRRYFLPTVLRVKRIKEEYGTITLDVETDKGERTYFVQNLRDSIQNLPPHRLIITDRDGNRFEFPDTERLDPKTHGIIQRVL